MPAPRLPPSCPTFRDAFARGRCGIPTDGFFEWTGPKSQRRPLWFRRNDGEPMVLAGLYRDTSDPGDRRGHPSLRDSHDTRQRDPRPAP